MRLLSRPGVRPIGFGLLILLMLLMPVSYRAGSETVHAHSILQGVVNTVTGHTHHHHEETSAATSRLSVLPLSQATVPIDSWMTSSATGTAGASSGAQLEIPDIPERMGLYGPIEPSSPIQELGALIVLLLAGAARASLWGNMTRLLQVCNGQDLPPPRPAS